MALIVAGVAAVALQRNALVDAIDTALIARVEDLSALLVDGVVPAELTVPGDDDALVQIIDDGGAVIAASGNIGGEGPISDAQPASHTRIIASRALPIGEGEFRLVAGSVMAHDRVFTVYAAASLGRVSETVGTLSTILLVGIPLLILFVGVIVWVIVGRTLYPVEAIRAEVASIGDRRLDRRVPVPDTDDEIGRLAGTMNEMLDRLQQASGQQRRFVADASHELRSPLSAIRSQLEVDMVHPDQADWPKSNAEVLDETLRMQRLVDDLLLLARSDSGTLPSIRGMVDLDDVVFEQVARVQPTTPIAFDTIAVCGAKVMGDFDALSRLVRNLIENAARFASSRVDVALTERNGLATLTVDDDGTGIPSADRSRVFDRFTRLDEARDRDHGGAGLGLAIAKEIADHHAATIRIDKGRRGGTCVIVVFPSEAEIPEPGPT